MSEQRFTHVAVTVARELFQPDRRAELLDFYGRVFGWSENPRLAIPDERIFLRAPNDTQYITIRASDEPMDTSGYEHLGVSVDTEASLRELHARASACAEKLADLELEPIRSEYGGSLVTFRLRFRLPLSIEVQHLRPPAS